MLEFSLEERQELYKSDRTFPFFCADIAQKICPIERCEKCFQNNRDQWFDCWVLFE